MKQRIVCPIIVTRYFCSGIVSTQTAAIATVLNTVSTRYRQWVLAGPEQDFKS
ncbi:hypothetical protein SV7mr_36580 [Stieleria bergensis]|uniref:Uncharacterized protein n=1 Tax=Stieleria bergensis TaxID=2528025 RepID=A0A517SY96_9BACT|nr:hypothetical protein SV7mr_36580 [Planctomycetes bacterium SV_7m_r]